MNDDIWLRVPGAYCPLVRSVFPPGNPPTIAFSRTLSKVEQIVVEQHLAAQFGIPLPDNAARH